MEADLERAWLAYELLNLAFALASVLLVIVLAERADAWMQRRGWYRWP